MDRLQELKQEYKLYLKEMHMYDDIPNNESQLIKKLGDIRLQWLHDNIW